MKNEDYEENDVLKVIRPWADHLLDMKILVFLMIQCLKAIRPWADDMLDLKTA